jgi:putative FmdB family regulatory protein
MPTYDLVCPACQTTRSVVTTVADRPQSPPCPQCQTPMERCYQPVGFALKGTGWTPKGGAQ